MLDFGYPFRMGDGMVYCKERHPLLLKWVITFLRCITKMEGDSERASTDPCCPHHAISAIMIGSSIVHKIVDCGYHMSTGNGMHYIARRHTRCC